jgi:glycosyltransferase involved in cell wall biosynthesis
MEPLLGGTLRHLRMILRGLPADEFDVHLAVSHRRNPAARDLYEGWRAAGFTVHDLPLVREPSPRRDAAALWKLLGICRRERFQVVHTHSSKAGFLGRFAGRMAGATTLHTPHVPPFGRHPGDRAYLPLERVAARWTARFIALSDYQARLLRDHGLAPHRRILHLPNAVDPARFAPMDRAGARRELGLDPRAPLVLGVGRLCRQKGFDLLVEAAALLARAGEPAHFILLGDGPMGPALQRRIAAAGLQERFLMPGRVENLRAWYGACDLVAMPSRWEGMPYVLLEAKAAARPAVVARVSGMEEFVREGVDGRLVPPGSPPALAHALIALLRRREELDAMGRRAREGLRQEWQEEHFQSALRDIYRETARRGHVSG